MRDVLAATIDIAAAGAFAFAGFGLATLFAPCRNLGDCEVLGPSVIALAVIGIALYFGGSIILLGTTAGQYLTHLNSRT